MIFPFISGFLPTRLAPATWTLIIINFCILLMMYFPSILTHQSISLISEDYRYNEVQGQFFAEFVLESGMPYSDAIIEMAEKVHNQSDFKLSIELSRVAFSDRIFLQHYEKYEFKKDKVITNWWRNKFYELNILRERLPSSVFGISSVNYNIGQAISYLFLHSGFMHLFGNMLFLLLFGAALETVIGSVSLLLAYLISGVSAAAVFYALEPLTPIPLIGASGAVSGIVAMFCVLFWGKGVRYFFMVLPKEGYYGFIYLPAWVAFIKWFISDVAGYFSTPTIMGGGVAYSAHLGGELAGILAGILFLFVRKYVLNRQGHIQAGFVDTKSNFTLMPIELGSKIH